VVVGDLVGEGEAGARGGRRDAQPGRAIAGFGRARLCGDRPPPRAGLSAIGSGCRHSAGPRSRVWPSRSRPGRSRGCRHPRAASKRYGAGGRPASINSGIDSLASAGACACPRRRRAMTSKNGARPKTGFGNSGEGRGGSPRPPWPAPRPPAAADQWSPPRPRPRGTEPLPRRRRRFPPATGGLRCCCRPAAVGEGTALHNSPAGAAPRRARPPDGMLDPRSASRPWTGPWSAVNVSQ
jgi:hypothetical protein